MKLTIESYDLDNLHVDRDSIRHDHGREGFYFHIGGIEFYFKDEADAEKLAKAILDRLGQVAVPQRQLTR
jgi:hypothetical protein